MKLCGLPIDDNVFFLLCLWWLILGMEILLNPFSIRTTTQCFFAIIGWGMGSLIIMSFLNQDKITEERRTKLE